MKLSYLAFLLPMMVATSVLGQNLRGDKEPVSRELWDLDRLRFFQRLHLGNHHHSKTRKILETDELPAAKKAAKKKKVQKGKKAPKGKDVVTAKKATYP
eukprot:scaffold2246_cov162-Amphora_coffeaeformis.AAC.18